jgi:hypothetical protein
MGVGTQPGSNQLTTPLTYRPGVGRMAQMLT